MPPIPAICPLTLGLPRSFDTLAETGSISYVGGGLETLALIGTQLDRALVTTNNGRALLSGIGGFGAYQDSASRFRMSSRRMTLRVDPQARVQLARIDGRSGAQSALTVADARGVVSLRIETEGSYDRSVLRGLDSRPRTSFPPCERVPVYGSNVIELRAVRRARAIWDDSDTGQHLNDMLHECGRARCAALAYVGEGRARAVLPAVLPSFLTYLADRGIAHARLVPGAGYLQGDLFKTGAVRKLDQVLLLEGERRSFAVDLSQIGSVWVTHVDRAPQLEVYDACGQAIAVLRYDVNSDQARWAALLESLPTARPQQVSRDNS